MVIDLLGLHLGQKGSAQDEKVGGYQDMVTRPTRLPSPRCQAMPLRCLSPQQLAVCALGYKNCYHTINIVWLLTYETSM